MACTRPINGYRSPSGKFFTTPYPGSTFMQVPCGQCVNCRLNHSREWAIRCTHEAQMWDQNCFITLTYNDENLPEGGTLVRKHLTDFFKRLRKHFTGRTIRYFACGEYGSKLQRPHYHVILFNLDFEDKRLYKHGDFPLYNSDTLSRLWPMGFSVLAGFSFESAAYTARYCVKKITGQKAESHYNGRTPAAALTLLAVYGLAGFGYIITATYLPLFLSGSLVEFDPVQVWAVFGLAAVPSCFFWHRLVHRYGYSRSFWLNLILQAIGVLLPVISHNLVLCLASALLVGFTFMGTVTIALPEARRLAGVVSFNMISAMTAVYGIGQIAGPLVAGELYSLTGSFNPSLVVAALCLFAAGNLVLFSSTPIPFLRRTSDENESADD